ncbi:hypothetical protein MTR67_018978, partial [Solanum verrucosum]
GLFLDTGCYNKSLQDVFSQKVLNLRQRRWLELLKDYDMSIIYHPSKANVVVNALSRLSMGSTSHVEEEKRLSHPFSHTAVWKIGFFQFKRRY